MIKKTVSYKDFDDKPHTQDLYFHLKVDALTDNLNLGDRLEALQELFDGTTRELNTAEKQEILDVVKTFINLSYGKRVVYEGESRFKQRPEILEDFRDSAAYDAFLWALFQDPKGAMAFLTDVMPSNLLEEARKAQEANGPKRPQDFQQKAQPSSVPTVSDSEQVDLAEEDEDLNTEALRDGHLEVREESEEDRLRRQLAELQAAAANQD